MENRKLGNSGLRVPEIGLGGNTFGWVVDEKTSAAIINCAFELGINYIDTADIYGRGSSEEHIGKALKGKRSQVIIATKFGYPRGLSPDVQGGSRNYLMKAIESSLKRLSTDYIDIYYIHFPDTATPILPDKRHRLYRKFGRPAGLSR